jgi:hypothetical protein
MGKTPERFGYGVLCSKGRATWSETNTDSKPNLSASVATRRRFSRVASGP